MQSRSESNIPAPEIHLRDYWKIIWQGRYTVLTILLLVSALAVLKVVLATPVYRATAVLEVRPEARRILPGQEQWVGADSRSWIAEELYFNTQREVLGSRDLAQRVFKTLGLDDHPTFAGLADPVGRFKGRIEVRPKVNTRLIEVSMAGSDPAEITEWVNALAEAYVKRNVTVAAQSFSEIMDQVQLSMADFRTSLEGSDQERIAAAGQQQLYVPESKAEIVTKNLEAFNRRRTDLSIELSQLEAELTSLSRIRVEGGDLRAIPRFSKDAVLQDLTSQKLAVERDLERLASEKTPRHPEYLARRTDLNKIEQRIQEQVARLEEKMREEYRLAKSGLANLQRDIKRTEEEAYRIAQAATVYDLLKTDAESKRRVYDLVAEKVNQLSLGAQLISMNNNVSVLDRAIEPRAPIRPRKLLTLALAGMLGLMLGVGAVLFLDYLDNTVRTPEDIEQFLGLGMLAMVPKYRDSKANAVREAFQSLRTSILFSSHNRERKLLLFSSAGPQEGKSGTVNLVSRSLASAGDRVVIVDCDLRRPTQHKHQDVPREPGLTNYLLDGKDGEIQPFIQETDVPNLSVLTSGPIPPNPAELVGLTKFRDLLQELKRQYDWVVVDSPPVASLADSVVLASMADTMILVIKHNQNDRDLIRRCLKRLNDIDVNIAGAVLNMVDMDTAYYSSYYVYGYYASDSAEGKSKKKSRRAARRKLEGERSSDKVAL